MGSWVADHGGSSGQQTWAKVFAELAARDTAFGLDVDGLQRLAVSAHLVGRVEDSVRAWERAHRAYAEDGQIVRATRLS